MDGAATPESCPPSPSNKGRHAFNSSAVSRHSHSHHHFDCALRELTAHLAHQAIQGLAITASRTTAPHEAASQGAHDCTDRLAAAAALAAKQLDERVSSAEEVRDAKTGPLRDTRDDWVESVRTTVRGKPVAHKAAAVVPGAEI